MKQILTTNVVNSTGTPLTRCIGAQRLRVAMSSVSLCVKSHVHFSDMFVVSTTLYVVCTVLFVLDVLDILPFGKCYFSQFFTVLLRHWP